MNMEVTGMSEINIRDTIEAMGADAEIVEISFKCRQGHVYISMLIHKSKTHMHNSEPTCPVCKLQSEEE